MKARRRTNALWILMALTMTAAAVVLASNASQPSSSIPGNAGSNELIVCPGVHSTTQRPPAAAADTDSLEAFQFELLDPAEVIVVSSADLSARLHTIRAVAESVDASFDGVSSDRTDQVVSWKTVLRERRNRSTDPPPTSVVSFRTSAHLPDPAPRRRALIPVFSGGSVHHQPQMSEVLCFSDRVQVYSTCGEFMRERAVTIARRVCDVLENDLLDKVSELVHPVADCDDDGRLTIVVTALHESSDSSRASEETPVYGVVRPADWIGQSGARTDVIYLDQHVPDDDRLAELLAHELTHAAVFSAAIASADWPHSCGLPVWLNEGIAHTVERQLVPLNANLRSRLEHFRRDSGNCPVIPDELLTTLATRRAGPRAAATLFVEELANRGFTLRELALLGPNAAHQIASIDGTTMQELFSQWAVAVAARGFYEIEGGEVGQLEPVTLSSGQSATCFVRGTAMLCLKPEVVPCRVFLNAPRSAEISAVLLTP